jgi:hypothetical protein
VDRDRAARRGRNRIGYPARMAIDAVSRPSPLSCPLRRCRHDEQENNSRERERERIDREAESGTTTGEGLSDEANHQFASFHEAGFGPLPG